MECECCGPWESSARPARSGRAAWQGCLAKWALYIPGLNTFTHRKRVVVVCGPRRGRVWVRLLEHAFFITQVFFCCDFGSFLGLVFFSLRSSDDLSVFTALGIGAVLSLACGRNYEHCASEYIQLHIASCAASPVTITGGPLFGMPACSLISRHHYQWQGPGRAAAAGPPALPCGPTAYACGPCSSFHYV